MTASHRRVWRPDRPVDLVATLGGLRRGRWDPCWRQSGQELWRAIRTPAGAATVRLLPRPREGNAGVVQSEAWGAGGEWLLERLPVLLGGEDELAGFVPHHQPVAAALRRFPGWRVPKTGLVLESLIPAVIEQKVTGAEAFSGWRRLVQRFGDRAPGPAEALGLRVPPAAATLRAVPSWDWAQAGVSPQRADTVMRVLRSADRLERLADLPQQDLPSARKGLMAIPGVGVWTAAETAHRALGDPDAVSFGDYHVAANIGWALTGSPATDAELAELLRPYAGHRYRVQRLLELSGAMRPRQGPRMPLRRHLPVR